VYLLTNSNSDSKVSYCVWNGTLNSAHFLTDIIGVHMKHNMTYKTHCFMLKIVFVQLRILQQKQ